MKNFKRFIILVSLILIISFLSSCKKGELKENVFHFSSYKTFDKVEYDIYYSDDYFKEKSSKYNTHLLSASACMALASGSSIDPKTGNPKQITTNIKEFYKVIGFNSFKSNVDGESLPKTTSFGVYCAKREIDDFTLISISVRGFGYLVEWASNFKLGGNDLYAEGFYDASSIYLDTLRSYIKDNNIKGKIKIWTSGYSRGGAGVNLAIGRIDDELVNGNNILSDDVTYEKDDIYAFCFEAPCGKVLTSIDGKIKEKGEDYNNIYCIVNSNDFVTYVAPKTLGYIRYGIDYYLPNIENDLNYIDYINGCKNVYNNLPNKDILGEYDIDKFIVSSSNKINYTLGLYMKELIDIVGSTIETRQEYHEKFEPSFVGLAETIFKNNSVREVLIDFGMNFAKRLFVDDENEILVKDVLYNQKRLFKDLKPILNDTLSYSAKIDINVDDLLKLLEGLSPILIGILTSDEGFNYAKNLLNTTNMKILAKGHIPELCLSYITSLDSKYGYTDYQLPTSYYTLEVPNDNSIDIMHDNVTLSSNDYSAFAQSNNTLSGYKTYFLPVSKYDIKSEKDLEFRLYLNSGEYVNPLLITSNTIKENSIVKI